MGTESLGASYGRVLATVARAAERVGRDPAAIQIVAVTKLVPVDRIREAIQAGLRRFGENRVQEALPKIAALQGSGCEWHLIGHLQTNKARLIDGRFQVVQSIDSVRIVEALAARLTQPLDVLLEINVGEEAHKTGAPVQLAAELARAAVGSGRLRVRGLMTIAPQTPDAEGARPWFRRLRMVRDQLADELSIALPELSMGMTDDYPIAVAEGSTMLRLGRALFGPR